MRSLPFLLGLGPNFPWAEVSVETKISPPKGHGVFATGQIKSGTFVCQYRGELLTLDEQEERYPDSFPEYCLRLSSELGVDAQRSEHWSRLINHNERANLKVNTQLHPEPCAYFEAIRDIAPGEELSFDYGPVYFHMRGIQPAPGTESRVVAPRKPDDPAVLEEEEVWREADLPNVPLTSEQIQMVLSSSSSVSERMKKAAFVRALDYFGAIEWHDDDTLTLKIGENNANGEGRGRRISYSFIEATELATNLEEVIQNIQANK